MSYMLRDYWIHRECMTGGWQDENVPRDVEYNRLTFDKNYSPPKIRLSMQGSFDTEIDTKGGWKQVKFIGRKSDYEGLPYNKDEAEDETYLGTLLLANDDGEQEACHLFVRDAE